MKPAAGLLPGGILLFGVLSCAPLSPRPTAPVAGRPAAELVNDLTQRIDRVRSLRSLANVYYSGADGRGSFQEAILVRRPDRLRLETLSHLGALLILTADGNEVAGFHPQEALFYRGRSSKENISRYTRIPLELSELTSLLLGLPPFDARGSWEGEGDSIERQIGGGLRDAITFDPQFWVPAKWARSGPDGKAHLSASFGNFSSTPAGPFPLKISFEDHGRKRRLEITYQEPEVNAELSADLFMQKKPAHARELPLESLPSPLPSP